MHSESEPCRAMEDIVRALRYAKVLHPWQWDPRSREQFLIAWSTSSVLQTYRRTYQAFQTLVSFTLFTAPSRSASASLFLQLPLLFLLPLSLTSALILWLLGLSSIQRLLWNQLTNSSPDKLPISRGQREEEKRDWSSIELIAVLLNAPSEEEGRGMVWGRERRRECV